MIVPEVFGFVNGNCSEAKRRSFGGDLGCRGKGRPARASARLAVGDQEDILTGIQQLAQIYATVQSGGALAALGAIPQQPREPQPEIYALNTGNKFEVTPIFDPSGQALRFKFDFVATANVQEPNAADR